MSTLTYQTTLDTLRAIAAEKGPDYVYTNAASITPDHKGSVSCDYVHPDGPGCIIGVLLTRIAGPFGHLVTQALSKHEGSGIASFAHTFLNGQYEDDVLDLMRLVQAQQDKGVPWVLAVEAAHYAVTRKLNRTHIPSGFVDTDLYVIPGLTK